MCAYDLLHNADVAGVLAGQGPLRLLIDSSGIGGIERHVAVLAGGLRRRGIDARILLLADHGRNAWRDQLAAAGIPFDILRGGIAGLARLCRDQHTPLVHTHGYKAGIIGRAAGLIAGLPIVSTYHAGERAPFPVSLYQCLDEWSGLLSTRISVSDPIRRRLPFSSTLVANFLDVPASPPKRGLRGGIGFVGRLSAEKGPDMFCRAAANLRDIGAWHAYGDGPMRDELEAAHGDHVRFHGMVADVSAAWRELGLLVISSYAEGLPMVALEALAAGIPVAAARVGALPEVIDEGENGWLFDAGDDAALQAIIENWSQQRALKHRDWRHAAWKRARDGFGLQRGLDATLAVYQQAMRGRANIQARSYRHSI